jgi:hypothetical protein
MIMRVRRKAAVLAAAACLLMTPPVAAAELSTSADGADPSRSFALTWPDPVTVRSDLEGRELTLRFSRPLGDVPIADLEPRLAGAVETIRYGYDSLLLRLAPDTEPDVAITGNGVQVTLTPLGTANGRSDGKTDATPAPGSSPALLEFVRAKALLNAGEVVAARAELQSYIANQPIDQRIAQAARIARTEGRSGSPSRSFTSFDRLLRADPGNPVVLAQFATVLIDNGKLKLARNVLDYR